MVSTSSHRSMAMMLAPSCAKRTAWGPSLAASGTGDERYFSLNSAHLGTFPSVHVGGEALHTLLPTHLSLQEPGADVKPAAPAAARCPTALRELFTIAGNDPVGASHRWYRTDRPAHCPRTGRPRLRIDHFALWGARDSRSTTPAPSSWATCSAKRACAPCSRRRRSTWPSPVTDACAALPKCSWDGSAASFPSGGAPVYRGFFDPAIHHPPGLPIPTREDAELASESDDGKSYRIGRTEQLLFASHPTATHFRYPLRLRPTPVGSAGVVCREAHPRQPPLLHPA